MQTLTYDMIDDILNNIESMPENNSYYPTIDELKKHNIKDNIIKYAPFLLWLSNSMEGKANKDIREANAYIKKCIYDSIKED